MISFTDISVVVQGALGPGESRSIAEVLAAVRRVLPGAPIVLSTWRGTATEGLDADQIVMSDDPGALPPLKFDPPLANNVNRQIVSTRAGLNQVQTPYALKMRTDLVLENADFIAAASAHPARDSEYKTFADRIVISPFFTINPRAFEDLPGHVSDVFQFGRTSDLQKFWAVDLMTEADATYFERRPHRPGVSERLTCFRARFAVEQYLVVRGSGAAFFEDFDTMDDVDELVRTRADRWLVNNFVIYGGPRRPFAWPKYDQILGTSVITFGCYDQTDWLWLYRRLSGGRLRAKELLRSALRRATRAVYLWSRRTRVWDTLTRWPVLKSLYRARRGRGRGRG